MPVPSTLLYGDNNAASSSIKQGAELPHKLHVSSICAARARDALSKDEKEENSK